MKEGFRRYCGPHSVAVKTVVFGEVAQTIERHVYVKVGGVIPPLPTGLWSNGMTVDLHSACEGSTPSSSTMGFTSLNVKSWVSNIVGVCYLGRVEIRVRFPGDPRRRIICEHDIDNPDHRITILRVVYDITGASNFLLRCSISD